MRVVSFSENSCILEIEGKRYEYLSYIYSGKSMADKFNKISKYSLNRAIKWLESVSYSYEHVY